MTQKYKLFAPVKSECKTNGMSQHWVIHRNKTSIVIFLKIKYNV